MHSALRSLAGPIYDWQLPLERAALSTAAELAAAGPDDRLLDLATGTGGLLRSIADRGTRPAEVVGIDSSGSMLAFAAARLPAGWSLLKADARELECRDSYFDVVTACYLLHLLDTEDRRRVLNEVARVLRPGGRVVTLTVESRSRTSVPCSPGFHVALGSARSIRPPSSRTWA